MDEKIIIRYRGEEEIKEFEYSKRYIIDFNISKYDIVNFNNGSILFDYLSTYSGDIIAEFQGYSRMSNNSIWIVTYSEVIQFNRNKKLEELGIK